MMYESTACLAQHPARNALVQHADYVGSVRRQAFEKEAPVAKKRWHAVVVGVVERVRVRTHYGLHHLLVLLTPLLLQVHLHDAGLATRSVSTMSTP